MEIEKAYCVTLLCQGDGSAGKEYLAWKEEELSSVFQYPCKSMSWPRLGVEVEIGRP